MALKSTLKSLEAALKKNYPRRHRELGPPADASSLDALQSGVGFRLPADVHTLFGWHRSAPGLLVDDDTDDSSDGWTLNDPEGVLADHREWSELQIEGWHAAWLPLFTNASGDNVCLDTRDGRLLAFFHEEPEDPKLIAASLDSAFAYVLARVKAGRWRGAPEKDPVPAILAKLRKSPSSADSVFGNDVFRLLSTDPPAVLEVVAQAGALGLAASLLRKFELLAHLAENDADATNESYLAYLAAIRAEGASNNPPFQKVREGFEGFGQPARAAEVAELEAIDKEYLLYKWLRAFTPATDEARLGALRGFVASIDEGLAQREGPRAARAASLKAAALRALGDAAAAESAWQLATASDRGVAEIWKTHPLLSAARDPHTPAQR